MVSDQLEKAEIAISQAIFAVTEAQLQGELSHDYWVQMVMLLGQIQDVLKVEILKAKS